MRSSESRSSGEENKGDLQVYPCTVPHREICKGSLHKKNVPKKLESELNPSRIKSKCEVLRAEVAEKETRENHKCIHARAISKK